MKIPSNQLNRLAREEVDDAIENAILRVARREVGANAQQFDEAAAR